MTWPLNLHAMQDCDRADLGLYEEQVSSPFWLAGVNRRHSSGVSRSGTTVLTLTGIALSDQPNHQGRAVAALGGAGEGLDAELVSFGLQGEPSETNQVTGRKLWACLLWTDL